MTIPLPHDPGKALVTLANAMDAHFPGYVDSYFVAPETWVPAETGGTSLSDLVRTCDAYIDALAKSLEMPQARKAFLVSQVRAMRSKLDMKIAGRSTVHDEVRAFLSMEPRWISEAVFEQAKESLDDLLPKGAGSLCAREYAHRAGGRVVLADRSPIIDDIMLWLHGVVKAHIDLPDGDSIDVSFDDKYAARGYHRYLGGFTSTVVINSTQVLDVAGLTGLLAHEGHPGHHTELVVKDVALVRARNWIEHQVTVVDVPACVIAEGIATRGLVVLTTEDERVDRLSWICARHGYESDDIKRRVRVEAAKSVLRTVTNNVALLLDNASADEEDIISYIMEHALADYDEAKRMLRFVRGIRCYACTYFLGGDLMDDYLSAKPDPISAFLRVLKEPMSPPDLALSTNNKGSMT